MCGIAALINYTNPIAILKMVTAMRHRGPDDKGTWSNGSTHLGMARLAILDLSPAGHQPMISADGRFVLIFNGEIYNFRELHSQFLANETLSSDGDTVVLMHLFQKMGIACVEHLRGMFAFVIWDNQTQTLWGARDRMGIKPLWYYLDKGLLAIASEVKSLLACGEVPFELEPETLRQFFLYGSLQHPNSFIKGVFSIAPATWFSFRDGKLETNTYWNFPTQTDDSLTHDKAVQAFREVYDESFQLRMISDRTVGIFLSSGLDSASLLASQHGRKHPIRTFTVGFDTYHNKYYSETAKAAALSKHFGYENDSILINAEDATNSIDEFVHGLDQPSIDGLNTFLVSKYSKRYLTVALSGLGGDELMLGYPRNINLFNLLNRNFQLPRRLAERYLLAKSNRKSAKDYLMDAMVKRAGGAADLKLLYWSNRLINGPWQVNGMLEETDRAEADLHRFYEFDKEARYNGNDFNTISYFEMRSYMLSQLLRDMDAVSMSQSIEVRFPLVDHKLVELLFRIPWNLKYKPMNSYVNHRSGGTTYASSGSKQLLQDVYREVLPEGFLNTPKQGFQLPFHQWMLERLGFDIDATFNYLLDANLSIQRSFIEACQQNIRRGIFEKNDHLLYIFGKWHLMIQQLVKADKKQEAAFV